MGGLVTFLVGAVLATTRPWEQAPTCPPIAAHPTWSVARRWDEALLDAIRRALPNPPVHARNLFHVSVAMWDAWAAYDPTASGYLFREKLHAPNPSGARNEAISYAAYRVLTSRFIKSVGADASLGEFDDLMDALCLPIADSRIDGDSPAAVGNRIAKALLDIEQTAQLPRCVLGDVRGTRRSTHPSSWGRRGSRSPTRTAGSRSRSNT